MRAAGVEDNVGIALVALEFVDAFMENFYADDDVTLAEWRSARHIKSAKKTKTPAPPPPL